MTFDLLLAEDERPSFHFEGDVEGLKSALKGDLHSLFETLTERRLLIISGHPGSGKSTILRALSALTDSPLFKAFHIDDYIDWGKVIPFVQDNHPEDKWDQMYLPVANSAALAFLRESLNEEKLLVVEGSGLISDYLDICQELGLPTPSFVLLDGSYEVFKERLRLRGDDLETKQKEMKEHQDNLLMVEKVNGLVINTDETQRKRPLEELKTIIKFAGSV